MALTPSASSRPGTRSRHTDRFRAWLRMWLLRGESGQAAAEHAGALVVAVIVILALVVGFTPLGGRIATGVQCALASVFSDGGGGACGDESVTPVTVGRPKGDEASAPNDASGGLPQSPGGGKPQDTKPKEPADQQKVNEALKGIREDLRTGWFNPVSTGDLDNIENRLKGLNGAEVDAVIAGMSDDELRRWVEEMEQGWQFGNGGWTTQRRQEMWTQVLPDASYDTVRRLAGITNDIQPRFDDVKGDDKTSKEQGAEFSYRESEGLPVVNGVSPSDISQGQIGDCWYIAALKAVAAADPSVIENAITDNGNGTYTVRLYHDGTPVYVTVTGDQVIMPDGRQGYAQSKDGKELWPQIMEKALASYEGSYGVIEGGWSSNGMEALTGKPSTSRSTDSYSAADLKAELDQGHAVALSSRGKPWWPWDKNRLYDDHPPKDSKGNELWEPLVYGHAYQVTSVDLGDPNDPSDDTVTIQNPWYNEQPMTLPYEDWRNGFTQVHVNPVK